jgi:hypothetical protein
MKRKVCALFVLAGLACAAEVFEGEFASLSIGTNGVITSICEKPSGRELCGEAKPLMTAVLTDGKRARSATFRHLDGNRYGVGFRDVHGTVTLAIENFRGGWTFRVEKAMIQDLEALVFLGLKPVCNKYIGSRINGLSDDKSAVVLRAYRMDGVYGNPWVELSITYRSSTPFEGAAVGLAAGDRKVIPEMMRAMTLAAGVPHSDSGGGWSLDSEMNRYSYIIADAAAVDTMDDLMEIAERTGVNRFHFRRFWDHYGWYGMDTNKFPRGLEDLRACSFKAKAAGLKTSIHNLSGCIGPNTPWIPTEMADGIRICHRYTLAEPIPAEAEITEIRVNEKPAKDHGFNFATWSRGNTIRIGTELFQYSDISFEPPYAFKGVQRARFGSKKAAHAAGANADYLWCFFGAFLAEPGSPLALASAKRYAEVYKAGDFDGIYNDGLDGYHRNSADYTRVMYDFYEACAATGKAPHYEDSLWTASGWWFHSMVGSWDYASYSPKTFTDRHLEKSLIPHRIANFQQISLGWWPVCVGSHLSFGYMRDDVEYFGAKIAGHDCGFSLIPNYARGHVQNYTMIGQEVLLGWYERLRVARAFKPRHLAAFREKGADFRLSQDVDGVWKVRMTQVTKHHMVSPVDRSWTVPSPAELPAAIRIRTLDAGDPWDGTNTLTILSSSMVTNLAVRSEKGVSASIAAGSGEHGATLRMTATNKGAERNNSWSVAERTIPRPYLSLWAGGNDPVGAGAVPDGGHNYRAPRGTPLALGVWVKGDGSGVDVNLQLHSPVDVNNARSEHHLTLDFTGWRYFVFSIWRDHLPEFTERYRWPYLSGAAYCIYERAAACQAIENVSIWMNGLNRGQTAAVEISDLRVMRETHPTLANASVKLNGQRHEVPFEICGGQYAELENGYWTLYSLSGRPLNRQKAESVPMLRKGANAAEFECADAAIRAQVTVTALGPNEEALVSELTPAARQTLSVESELPRFFAPSRNMADLAPLAVRPGERAEVTFTLVGPVDRPTISVGGKSVTLDRSLGDKDIIRGSFEGVVTGSVPVSMTCADSAKAAATLMLVKRYVTAQVAAVSAHAERTEKQ